MNKVLIQIIIIIVSLVIGGVSIGTFLNNKHDKALNNLMLQHKKEIEREIKLSKERIEERNKIITQLDSALVKDSLKIAQLNKQIILNNYKINKQREEAKKLTSDEKIQWLLNRYSTTNN